MANVDIQLAYKDTAWFNDPLNAEIILKKGQHVYLSDGVDEYLSAYKVGDGVTELQYLPFRGVQSLAQLSSLTGAYIDNTDSINPKLPITLPVEFNLNAYGDSITLGFNSTSSPLAYINLLGALYGKTVYNRAVSGKGIWEAARCHLFDVNPTNNVLSVVMAGLNDVRRGGSAAKTTSKILNGYKSIIANQFLKSFIPAGQISAFITRSGTWVNTYLGTTVGCKTDTGSYSNTNSGYIEYTFTGDNVVLGLVAGDGVSQIHADFTVSIDGVSQGSYTENNQTDGISDGSYDNRRSPMCLVFTGLTNETHTIRLTNTTTNYLIVDYFGHLKDAKFCAPLLIMHAPKLSTAGYAIVPNLANDTIINTLNSSLTALNSFLPEYPIYIGKTNDFYDITTGLDTDEIHPNDVGHHQIFCSAREALRYIPYLGKVDLIGYEQTTNKSSSVNTDKSSNTKYPSVKAVFDWVTGLFVKKGTLTTNTIPKATSFDTIVDSNIIDDGTNVGISTASPIAKLDVNGSIRSENLTPSQIVETDASKNLVSAAKGTAYNKDFGTGTTNIVEIGSTLGNSLISATDSNGKLQSLDTATYPSLTELTYVKGVTSALQTQLNSKASNFINKLNTDYTHTGTTSPTVIHSFEITPGTCEANDVLKFYLRHYSNNNANNKTIRIKANSTNTTVGATTVATYAYTTNSGGVFTFKRSLIFKNSLTSQKIINTTVSHANDDVSYQNNADATLSLDFNNSVFIFIEVTLANAADTFTMNLFNCKIER